MGLKEAISSALDALERVSSPTLAEVAPALRAAELEVASFIRGVPSSKAGSVSRKRALLMQLSKLRVRVDAKLGNGMRRELRADTSKAARISIKHMERMVLAGGSIPRVKLEESLVMARKGGLLLERSNRLGTKYGKDVADDVRRRLMTGVLAGDTREDLTKRLLQSSGLIRHIEKHGGLDRLTDTSAEKLRKTYTFWADRLAVTESAGAWNEAAMESISTLNRDDPGYMAKVDATRDLKVCSICKSLDGKLISPGGSLRGFGVPPFHCYCRCGLVPWRRDW